MERDINSEVLFWLEVVHLHTTVYKEPFNLPERLQKTMDSSSSLSKEEQLRRSIQQHIEENNMVAFRFCNIWSEPPIHELARQVHQEYYGKV